MTLLSLHFNTIESTERLESIERRERLERTKRLESMERLERMEIMERIESSDSRPSMKPALHKGAQYNKCVFCSRGFA